MSAQEFFKSKRNLLNLSLLLIVTASFYGTYLSRGMNTLDLDRSTIKCNFAPDYKVFSFKEAHWNFSSKDFENYDYKVFYTNPSNEEKIKSLIQQCNGGSTGIGDLTVQQGMFDIDPPMEFKVGSTFPIEKLRNSATYKKHVFDLNLVYFEK